MTDRMCDYSQVVKASGGKATCPDNLFRGYKGNGKCSDCLKTRESITIPRRSEGEIAADGVISEGFANSTSRRGFSRGQSGNWR